MLSSINLSAPAITIPVLNTQPGDRYTLKSITGLGPADVAVNVDESAFDGGYYQGRRVPPRQVVCRLGLRPNFGLGERASDLRNSLYAMLNASPLRMTFNSTNGTVRMVEGYVEKFETSQFVADPEIQFTMMCPNPFVRGITDTSDTTPTSVTYNGTVPVGFRTSYVLNSNTTWSQLTKGTDVIRINTNLLAGDSVIIDTRPGSRELSVSRSGVGTFSVLPYATAASVWPRLVPGTQAMSVTASAGTITWNSFTYRVTDWGL